MVDVAQLVEPRFVVPVVVGSSPIIHPILFKSLIWLAISLREVFDGPLAQLVEQLTLNQRVVGSIPTRPTINNTPEFCESGGIGRRTGFRYQRGNP